MSMSALKVKNERLEGVSVHNALKHKGINYDIGTYTRGGETSSREVFTPHIVKREMEIIKNDLQCTSVRISGKDIERLTIAAEYALKEGLEVWFSPAYVDADKEKTLAYFIECAKAAEKLRVNYSNVIFVTGCELSFFMKGLVLGETAFDRINTFMKPWTLLKSSLVKGSFQKNLNSFLSKAVKIIREVFKGEITYASGPWENVNWEIFDMVGIDYYKDVMNKNSYRGKLKTYFKYNKPVIITEFGCCTYKGAEDKGSYGWTIVDISKSPMEIKGNYQREESVQAQYIQESLDIFIQEKVEGAFVFTFVSQSYPYNENPRYDLDIAAYGVVKSYDNNKGETYKDMSWEPKKAFYTIAEYYGRY